MQFQFTDLEDKFKNLPKDIQNAISSVSVGKTMEEIGKKYRLHVDKMNELFDETGLVMLGLTHPKDYIKNLQKRLVIDIDTVKKIAADINEQIFRPIRESLKEIHNVVGEDQPSETNRQQPAIHIPEVQKEKSLDLRLKKETVKEKPSLGWPVPPALGKVLLQPATPEHKRGERDDGPQSSEQSPTKPSLTEAPASISRRQDEPARLAKQHPVSNMPKKSAATPENLPIKNEDKNEQPIFTEPKPALVPPKPLEKRGSASFSEAPAERKPETSTSNVIRGEKTEPVQTAADPSTRARLGTGHSNMQKKLIGSFKLPRTETEYKESVTPTMPKDKYTGGDPYREPIE